MSETNKKPTEQEQAIHEYLQSLLLEVPEETEPFADIVHKADSSVVELKPNLAHEEPKISAPVVGLDRLIAEVPETVVEVTTKVATEVISEVSVELKEETEVAVKVETEVELPPESESGLPEWAETRFQCLLFKVSGLSLAVPLVKLNSVIPWDENITETPNQTDWYLGLVQHLQNQIKVIDTALLVMPENRRNGLEHDTSERLSHILLVDDYKWGLACSSIGDVIWLNKDEVKWRKNKTSRAWLSGTSLEHLCAIMDTEVFAQMLTKKG